MLHVHAMGHFNPENIISNEFPEELDIVTTSKWTIKRVGIQDRRMVVPLDHVRKIKNINPRESFSIREYTNAGMAHKRAGLKPEDMGAFISSSLLPDNIMQAEASAVASEILRL
jgi:3-oxoacyl-[acyl-carrier-protein] synthase III